VYIDSCAIVNKITKNQQIMFLHYGNPKSIKDLDKPSLKFNQIDRIKIPILIIDDNDFEYLDFLKNPC
jgi:hypothetical protein